MNPLAVMAIAVLVAWSTFEGIKSFRILLSQPPKHFLDGDFSSYKTPPTMITELREAERPATTETTIVEAVDRFAHDLANEGPKQSVLRMFAEIQEAADFLQLRGKTRKIYIGFFSLALPTPLAVGIGFVLSCFESSTELNTQQLARTVSTATL